LLAGAVWIAVIADDPHFFDDGDGDGTPDGFETREAVARLTLRLAVLALF
jgi:hypothetical protein